MIRALSHKSTVSNSPASVIVEANPARRHLRIAPVGANVFIGGAELQTITSTNGARVTPDGIDIPSPACEAEIYAFGDGVEVEVLEFIQE